MSAPVRRAWTASLLGFIVAVTGFVVPAAAVQPENQSPVVAISTPVALPYYNRNTNEVRFTATDDDAVAKLECALDGAAYVSCVSPWKVSTPADGSHEVRVRATDSAGNVTTTTKTFVEDHTAPVVKVLAKPNWITQDTTARFVWSISDALSGVDSFTCSLVGEPLVGECTETGIVLSNLSEGSHTLLLRVKDNAGNGNTRSVYFVWVVDTTAPSVNITQAPASKTTDTSATITWNVSEWSSTTDECQFDDQPTWNCNGSVTYQDLPLGDHRLVIRVRDQAHNTAEKTVAWSVVAAPDAPADVAAAPGDQEAIVSWTRATEYGVPVTGYVVTASPGGRTVTVPADRTVASVSGLTNGTAYTFTVVATSAMFGGSPASAPSDEVVPAGLPDMPRQVSVHRGDQAALVSWDAANDNGAPVTGYTVTVSPGNRTFRVAGDQTAVLVDDLGGVGPYTFRVTASNRVGDGPPSNPASVTFADVPGAPTGVRAVRGDHAATVSWTPPTSDGGVRIDTYTITAQPGGRTLSVGTERNEFTMSGLTNGKAYTFTVTATNVAGDSAASGPSNEVSPAGVPGRVARPTVVRKTARSVVVRWTAPRANASPIRRYRVIPNIGKARAVAGSVRRVAFSSLRRGQRYEFTVIAVNGVGSSRPSLPRVIRIR